MQVIGYLAAALLFGAWLYASHLLAARVLPTAPAYARAAAAGVMGSALLVVLFGMLGALQAFRVWVALPLLVTIAAAAHLTLGRRDDVAGVLARDLESVRLAWRDAGWARWVALASIPVAIRTARGLVAPPLSWDALTYHLPKAGEWVQAGAFVRLAGPDSNRQYDFLAPYGDVLWAWAMLPVRGDALLAVAGLLVWLAIVLAAYACARSLGVETGGAFLASLATAMIPTVASLVTAAYVDNTVLAFFLFGCAFAVRALESRSAADAALAGVAFGMVAGTKMTGVAVVGIGALVAGILAVQRRERAAVPAIAAAILFAAPPYIRSWVETGNPLFPFEVALGGRVLFAGATRLGGGGSETPFSWWELIRALTTPFAASETPYVGIEGSFDRIAIGPALLALAPLGVLGGATLVRRGRGLAVFFLAAACSAIVVTQISSAATLWSQPHVKSTQRYVLAVPAILAVFSSGSARAWVRIVLALAAVAGGLLSLPRGLGPTEMRALPVAALAMLASLASCWFVARHALRRRAALAAGAALVAIALSLAALAPLRARSRYAIYGDAARQRSFDMHYIDPLSARAWPIWSALDRVEAPMRIAVAAGWGTNNWFRYPLLGSRLQNEIVYVPPTSDGSIMDYADDAALRRKLDYDAWLAGLVDADVDCFVALNPLPPETGWAIGAPQVFSLLAMSEDGTSGAWRFNKVGALAWLRARGAER